MNFTGLQHQLQGNWLTVILLVVGAFICFKAFRSDHKGAMTSVGVVLIGLLVIGLAVSGKAPSIGSSLVGLIT